MAALIVASWSLQKSLFFGDSERTNHIIAPGVISLIKHIAAQT